LILIFVIPYFVSQKFLTTNLRSRGKDSERFTRSRESCSKTAMIRLLSLGQKPPISRPYPYFLAVKTSSIPARNLAFPDHRNLKSSSPQMPVQDNETKGGIFSGKVIIVDNGKIVAKQLTCCVHPTAPGRDALRLSLTPQWDRDIKT